MKYYDCSNVTLKIKQPRIHDHKIFIQLFQSQIFEQHIFFLLPHQMA